MVKHQLIGDSFYIFYAKFRCFNYKIVHTYEINNNLFNILDLAGQVHYISTAKFV